MVQSLVEQWLDPAQGGAPTLSLVVLKKRLVDIMEKDLAFKAEYKAGKLALTLALTLTLTNDPNPNPDPDPDPEPDPDPNPNPSH